MNNIKLSVCMIVKDEELVLERCLTYIKQFADEIIIVDTGSKDKTIDIAKNFTDKVYKFNWQDDFAQARNHAFSLAKGEYLMWLDADDIITSENIEKIKNLKNSLDDYDVYMCKYLMNFDKLGKAEFNFYRERILRNNFGFKWQGFIHEAISVRGKVLHTDIEIEHRKVKSGDPERNLKIYEKHIGRGEKLDTRAMYYYSKELYYNGKYNKCVINLKKYLKMPNKYECNEIDAYLTLAICLTKLGKNQNALKYLFECLSLHLPTSEILCNIADIFIAQNKFGQAIFYYQSALNIEPNLQSGAFVDKRYYYLYPLLQLTYAHFRLGQTQKAFHYHKLCKLESPQDSRVIYNDDYFTYASLIKS